jgi:hypothetical protein
MSGARSYVLGAVALCLVLCALAVYHQNSTGLAQLTGAGLLGSKDQFMRNMALTNRTLLQFQSLFNSMRVAGDQRDAPVARGLPSTSTDAPRLSVSSLPKEQREGEWGPNQDGSDDALARASSVSRNNGKAVGGQRQASVLQITHNTSLHGAMALPSVPKKNPPYLNENVTNNTLNRNESQEAQVGPVRGRKRRQRGMASNETQAPPALALPNTSRGLVEDSEYEAAIYAEYNRSISMGNLSSCLLRVKSQLSLKLSPSREAVRQKLLASAHHLVAPLIKSLRYER